MERQYSFNGAWVHVAIIITLVIVSCTDIMSMYFVTPVQQFHPTCPCTFYTCSTLYLLNFLGEIFIIIINV